jgi:ribosome production factor 2
VIVFTSFEKTVCFRHYAIALKKGDDGSGTPKTVLEEYGPRMNLTLRRKTGASDSVQKEALRQPRELNPKKRKNVSEGLVGATTGRIHMQKQNLSEMALRRFKKSKSDKVSEDF